MLARLSAWKQVIDTAVHYGYLALAVFGLVIAHPANNTISHYVDLEVGIDTAVPWLPA